MAKKPSEIIIPNPPTPLVTHERMQYLHGRLRATVQHRLPLVYDDSLTFYELLCKALAYINEMLDCLNEMTKRLEYYDNRMKEYEEYFNNVIEIINEFKLIMVTWEGIMEEWNSKMINWDSKMNDWQNTINNWQIIMDSWQNTINGWQNTINNIQNTVNNQSNDISNIKNDITTIGDQITNINGSISNINNHLANIDEQITNINNNITAIQASLQGQIDSLKGYFANNCDWNTNHVFTPNSYVLGHSLKIRRYGDTMYIQGFPDIRTNFINAANQWVIGNISNWPVNYTAWCDCLASLKDISYPVAPDNLYVADLVPISVGIKANGDLFVLVRDMQLDKFKSPMIWFNFSMMLTVGI